jgi:hypothetical protein
VILFSNSITPRLQYISDFIGKEITGEPFQIISSIEDFRRHSSPKINYSDKRISDDEFFLKPHALLFEEYIRTQATECFEVNNNKAFFKTDGDFPFDIFAAAFYLLSRYEEYILHQKDGYGRYAHENSLAFKENFLDRPLINIWISDLKQALRNRFPSLSVLRASPRFLPTYDIDIAYSYKGKGFFRNMGGFARSILYGEWSSIKERMRVLRGKITDPYNAYDWMDGIHEKYHLDPRYFFLVAQRNGRYDKNISPRRKSQQMLIKQHADKYAIGVHPSWRSGDESALIKEEISTLEHLSGKKILASRQHYIRFNLPGTFRDLIVAGLREDFSMGYGSINGFRASVASPFYWYDLEKEKATHLLLYPFCFMDANSFYEQQFTPQQALDEMFRYYYTVKSVNGWMITIWHNHFLGGDKRFVGWKDAYETFINQISTAVV